MPEIALLPVPREMTWGDGRLAITDGKLIALEGGTDNFSTARRLQTAVRESAGCEWAIVAGTAVPYEQIGAVRMPV